LVKAEFPHAKLFVRAYDRGHVLRLIKAGVDYQIRETMESALTFASAVLLDLGVDPISAAETIEDVRDRDAARLELQIAGGVEAGRSLIRGNLATPQPAPLIVPSREAEALNEEAAEAIEEETA
jgi:glutathione-regulated potassium-efflux system protein KefB